MFAIQLQRNSIAIHYIAALDGAKVQGELRMCVGVGKLGISTVAH